MQNIGMQNRFAKNRLFICPAQAIKIKTFLKIKIPPLPMRILPAIRTILSQYVISQSNYISLSRIRCLRRPNPISNKKIVKKLYSSSPKNITFEYKNILWTENGKYWQKFTVVKLFIYFMTKLRSYSPTFQQGFHTFTVSYKKIYRSELLCNNVILISEGSGIYFRSTFLFYLICTEKDF